MYNKLSVSSLGGCNYNMIQIFLVFSLLTLTMLFNQEWLSFLHHFRVFLSLQKEQLFFVHMNTEHNCHAAWLLFDFQGLEISRRLLQITLFCIYFFSVSLPS